MRPRGVFPGMCGVIVVVFQLASFDGCRQMVLSRRQRAGGIGCKCAGRIMRLVEIENDFSIFGEVSVKESSGRVGLFPAGQILEQEEQPVAFEQRFQSELLAVDFKSGVPWTGSVFGVAENVQDRNHFRLWIRSELRVNSIRLFYGEPRRSVKVAARNTGLIPQ